MKKKSVKDKTRIGFRPIENGTRYTIKNGRKTKTLDVIKARKETSV